MRLHSTVSIFSLVLLATGSVAVGCGSNVTAVTGGQGGGTTAGAGGHAATTGAGGAAGTSTTAVTTTATTATTTTTTGAGGGPSTMYPAPHPPAPTVQTFGGPVLASPTFYPVFFSNDDGATTDALRDFTDKVGATPYWAAIGTEYGVGPATAAKPISLAEAAPATIDDSAIQTWLIQKLTGSGGMGTGGAGGAGTTTGAGGIGGAGPTTAGTGGAGGSGGPIDGFPTPDANTLIVLYYPATTTITLQGSSSCQTFGGYHSSVTLPTGEVAYAVLPRCANFGGMNALQATTVSASHEMIEASTDPYPQVNPAYATVDATHPDWARALGGGEVGDLCAQFQSSFTVFPPSPYMVQRTWSNKAALASHDPCVPSPAGQAYFNSAAVLPDMIPYGFGGNASMIPGVIIPVGGSKTIDLDLFSDGPVAAPWTIQAQDYYALMGGTPYLSLTLDQNIGENGQIRHLTIKVLAASTRKHEPFVLLSKSNGVTNFWLGIVGQ